MEDDQPCDFTQLQWERTLDAFCGVFRIISLSQVKEDDVAENAQNLCPILLKTHTFKKIPSFDHFVGYNTRASRVGEWLTIFRVFFTPSIPLTSQDR